MYNVCNMVISPDCKNLPMNTAPLSLEINRYANVYAMCQRLPLSLYNKKKMSMG